jgi:hypothetical protein
MPPAPDPLAELKDVMAQVLTETRTLRGQVEEMRTEFRAVVTRQRVVQRVALVALIPMLSLAGYFFYRSLQAS